MNVSEAIVSSSGAARRRRTGLQAAITVVAARERDFTVLLVSIGPLTATVGEQHNVDIPDTAAGATVLAGMVLLVAGMRRSA
jgi:hypothetical protein